MTVGCSDLLGLFPTLLIYALSKERISKIRLCGVCGEVRATRIDRQRRLGHSELGLLGRSGLVCTWFVFCSHVEFLLNDAKKIQYYTD
jgi:hypothetical protein